MKELLSDDGLTQTLIHQSGDRLVTADIVPGQRIDRILEANKQSRDNQNRAAQGRHVASIDPVTYANWKRDWSDKGKTVSWKEYLIGCLNNPENKYLRTTTSKIGLTSQDRE